MKEFSVLIRKRHIRRGVRRHEELCPICQALMDMGACFVRVFGGLVRFSDEEGRWESQLTPEALAFIDRYDSGAHVAEFYFKVTPMPVRS